MNSIKLTLALIFPALIAGCASQTVHQAQRQSPLIPLDRSLEPLQEQFNADKGKTRVIALFSPT